MEPSEKLRHAVASANTLDIKLIRQWVELLLKIPICTGGDTLIAMLHDILDDSSFCLVNDFTFRINLDVDPYTSKDLATVDCTFYPDHTAKIALESSDDGRAKHLEGKGFLGFEGPWEEVALKMVEMNNFLTPTAPPFAFK